MQCIVAPCTDPTFPYSLARICRSASYKCGLCLKYERIGMIETCEIFKNDLEWQKVNVLVATSRTNIPNPSTSSSAFVRDRYYQLYLFISVTIYVSSVERVAENNYTSGYRWCTCVWYDPTRVWYCYLLVYFVVTQTITGRNDPKMWSYNM